MQVDPKLVLATRDECPDWLTEVSERCLAELRDMEPSAQPSWYRYCGGLK